MRRLCAQLILAALAIPAVVRGDNTRQLFIDTPDACYQTERQDGESVYLKVIGTCAGKPGRAVINGDRQRVKVFVGGKLWNEQQPQPMGTPEVSAVLDSANRMTGTIKIPANSAEHEMKQVADQLNAYYRSPEFQGRLKSETERITGELFGDASGRFYPDSKAQAHGKLGSDERVYVFISSAMPLQTVRNYAASVARLRDPNVTLVMRGFVEGMTKIQPTIRFIASVLQRDASCNPADGECKMLPASLAVDPLLFRRYGIDRVPAVVYARGVKAEDAALSEGDSKNTSITENHTVYGDASLEYLLEQIQRETGSRTLADLLPASTGKN
ncbi:type-F conjugative transfer system pilin assembly protein [Geobacter sp. OR-1]|uniref:type-F conjugative transfer system pilin assembly protein TrbC n=1 Tax=Geobacter sp. OR-1 TaxID=1266765 RepID=UPI0005423CDA|nr:type-F conjugative transfer system pilin assembly protein TrbC [Geobacter sp. OR-1]GAM08400.1 type-F conjugative transfer system pilin assembly protein [Geobacter sp. OR-1]